MKYLGIDVGTKNVGIAISDDGGTVAFPHKEVIWEECIPFIKKIIKDKGIDTVVIGESLDLDGNENDVMKEVKKLKNSLKRIIPVEMYPEQFSTQAARQLGKGDDAQAATIILQSYLDKNIIDEEIDFD